MFILGLNAFHGGSSACLVPDGRLIAAAEKERFRRIKHWAGFLAEAIRYCLAEGGVGLGDVDVVAVNQDVRAHLWKKLAYMATHRPDFTLIADRIRNKKNRLEVTECLAQAFPGESIRAKIKAV